MKLVRAAVALITVAVLWVPFPGAAGEIEDNTSTVVVKLAEKRFEEGERIRGSYTTYFALNGYWWPWGGPGWQPVYYVYRRTDEGRVRVKRVEKPFTDEATVKINFALNDPALDDARRGEILGYVLVAPRGGHHATQGSVGRKRFAVVAD